MLFRSVLIMGLSLLFLQHCSIIFSIVSFTGLVRYFTVQSALLQGYFRPAGDTIALISVSLSILVVITLAILVAVI